VSAYILPSKLIFLISPTVFSRTKWKMQQSSFVLNWPSFLYPEGTTYDESELDKGLFRGHVLLRVRSTIFH
jgi:hypothetical protein